MSRIYRNIAYLADRGGTAFWRHTSQMMAINCIAQKTNIQYDCSQSPILDQNFYKNMTSVTVQRWISDQHTAIFNTFLKPICDSNAAFLIYAIDDAMHYDEIPIYNRGRSIFANDKIQSNIKSMLNTADFVIVTTQHLKEYYHKKYDVPLENIIAVPNLLPQWWFGGKYDPVKKIEQFKQNKNKPRIGIVSSLSHFNIENYRIDKNGKAVHCEKQQDGSEKWINQDNIDVNYSETQKITDDFDEICDCVRTTVNDFQWVFFGYCPPQVEDLAKAHKIEIHQSSPILNYPLTLHNLNLQAVIAPIQKTEFNFCKSHIKYMECAALGVPLFATNCLPYDRVMDNRQLFDTSDELKQKLLKLKDGSVKIYSDIIERQWNWLNDQHDEGDFHLNTYWLEPNLQIWIDLNRLRQKTIKISFSKFEEQYLQRKQAKQAQTNNILYKNGNVCITK